MNIDKDIIGKPPNQAIVINDKLINRQSKEKEDHSKDNKVLSEPFTDSRERLEADVRGICWGYVFHRYDAQKRYLDEYGLDVHGDIVTTNYDGHVLATVIMHMLDRQEEITERNCRMDYEDMRDYLQSRVDSLTAELQVIKNAENYKLADDSEPQVIAASEKHELAANDNLPAETDISADGHVRNATETADSRERLEADVRGAVHGAYAYEDYIPEDMIFDWLDRQAAITKAENEERECTIIGAWDDYAANLEDECDELQERVDNLTAERDEFADELKLDAIALDELRKQVDELTTERDHLKKVVQQQAESFRKMEVELSKAKAVSNECDR